MFGYVRPLREELLVREDELYRAVYCGVCRALGQEFGQISRMFLEYEAAAFALLWMSGKKDLPLEKRACLMHPGIPRPIVADRPELRDAARAAVFLADCVARDHAGDGDGVTAKAASGITGPLFLRAVPRETAERTRERLEKIRTLEKEGCGDLDLMARISGEITRDALLIPKDLSGDTREILGELGMDLGRWIYFADALDDEPRDRARGAYNVLLCGDGNVSERRALARDAAGWAMLRMRDAFDLLDVGPGSGILENIFRKGMPSVLEEVYTFPGGRKARRKGEGV